MSTRALLRAYQRVRATRDDDNAFRADLALLQHKDLDLSVRHGALLAFDALLLTAAINPVAASPGSPLSLDAATQPLEVWAIFAGCLLLAVSAYLCVRAILIGEEFSADGIEDEPAAIVQRMFAAYCASVDAQTRLLRLASRYTIGGGAVTALACLWIVAEKMTR